MVEKPITKKYLQERCSFQNKTVIGAVDFDGLYAIVKKLNPSEQKSIFRIVEKELKPLNEDQIDALLIYLPNEVKDNLDFIDLTKKEKLEIVRTNKENLSTIIDKKGYTENIDLDRKQVIPSEEYSSAKMWEIVKARAELD